MRGDGARGRTGWRRTLAGAAPLVGVALLGGCAGGGTAGDPASTPGVLRIAAFNVQELSTAKVDSVDAAGVGAHPQLLAAAAVIAEVRPDVLVLNEVDLSRDGYGLDLDGLAGVVMRFQARYLEEAAVPIYYPFVYVAPSNTGILSGLDLDGDGVAATPADVGTRAHGNDSFGFGTYPGQYAMAVLSRFPVDTAGARTFRLFRWRDLPGHHMPSGFYSDSAEAVLRLSSKSHWDLPVILDRDTLHLLVSHPTPPVFDGPEDRNGRRNFDEIAFWARYLDGSDALVDDRGRRGGLADGEPFVLAGDLNAAPEGGEAVLGDTAAISQLLEHPRIRDPEVLRHVPTASFSGGLRVDYVLPSEGIEVVGGGVYGAPGASAAPAGVALPSHRDDASAERALGRAASDHRLVWLDLRLPGG